MKKFWSYLRETVGLPTLIFAAIVVSYFVYSGVREWRMNNAIERQNERIEQYGRQAEA